MTCILHIETATNVCSVILSLNREIIFQREEIEGPSHSKLLGVFVEEAVQFFRKENLSINAIAVSAGPGSYTGLRIGVSEAKGLCYGLNIPLISIPTLELMAYDVKMNQNLDSNMLLCPMIDARRMEVYDAIFEADMEQIRNTAATIVDQETYSTYLTDRKIAFFGNGATKCQTIIDSKNAVLIENIYPRASMMVDLALAKYENKQFEDVAYYEPFYLKEFVGTIPKNKVLENL